jgi:hypothetical protein
MSIVIILTVPKRDAPGACSRSLGWCSGGL